MMKNLRVLFILLLSFYNSCVFPKIYYDQNEEILFEGRDFKNLDLTICLSRYKYDDEEKKWVGAHANDPILNYLTDSLLNEEAIIVSSSIVRALIDINSNDKIINKEKSKLEDLNNKEKWLSLITKNKHFVLLVPKIKYKNVKILDDIEKVGLNKNVFDAIESLELDKGPEGRFYIESEKAERDRIENISSKENPKKYNNNTELKNKGLIDHETILSIFSNSDKSKKINKRILLAGHGFFERKTNDLISLKPESLVIDGKKIAAVAQLQISQYVEFLNKLRVSNCSFLYVMSCYSGGLNSLASKIDSLYEEKNIFNKFDKIKNSMPFITVLDSNIDRDTFGKEKDILQLFIGINKFFDDERKALKELFEIKDKKLKIDINNLTEVEILNGNENVDFSLIEKKPWLRSSINNYILSGKDQYVLIKFPGEPFFKVSLKESSILDKIDKIKDLSIECDGFETKYDKFLYSDEYTNEGAEKIWAIYKSTKNELEDLKNELEDTKVFVLNYKTMLYIESNSKKNRINKKVSKVKNEVKNQFIDAIILDSESYEKDKNLNFSNKDFNFNFKFKFFDLLIFPSIVDLQVKFYNYDQKMDFISMIPGQAQHYIKSISIGNADSNILDILYNLVSSGSAYSKFYFISELVDEKNNSKLKNIALKVAKPSDPGYRKRFEITCLYMDPDGKYFKEEGTKLVLKPKEKKTNKVEFSKIPITEKEVKALIKEWTIESTPSKEALFEATEGIENINSFRKKIEGIFGKMF